MSEQGELEITQESRAAPSSLENSGAVMDLSSSVPASNKRPREGKRFRLILLAQISTSERLLRYKQ